MLVLVSLGSISVFNLAIDHHYWLCGANVLQTYDLVNWTRLAISHC
jgi:hypothetical protein